MKHLWFEKYVFVLAYVFQQHIVSFVVQIKKEVGNARGRRMFMYAFCYLDLDFGVPRLSEK